MPTTRAAAESASGSLSMRKYATEFLGTFFLVFTIGCMASPPARA